jgi:hypothetical protein
VRLIHNIRNLRFARRCPCAPADPYAQALATAGHLEMLRRSLAGEASPARWYR